VTTLTELIDACEADLADSGNATFAAADIQQWCRDAIADYSQHYPRKLNTTINCADNDREYDLPADLVGVISVEYPDGEDPPEYLRRRNYTHPDFWSDVGYYDVVHREDATDTAELWISEKPSTGEDIIVFYTAPHDNTIVVGGTLTVPSDHEPILRKYVLWQATLQLAKTEEASPTSNSSLLMSQLAINSDRARRSYIDALAKAIYTDSKSSPVSWANATSESERIY
jgi:hypothetical protein